ncbi:MAG: hypothetical protein AAFZ11_08790 [Pseudomonadota bacterium]
MVKKLREGLIDPHVIQPEDVPEYVATTYGGYFEAIQNRLWGIEYFLNRGNEFPVDFVIESVALQLRLCVEDVAFAIRDFDQILNGLIGKSKRTKNDVSRVLGKRKDRSVWPRPIDPSYDTNAISSAGEFELPCILVRQFESQESLKELEGKLGSFLHSESRPRSKVYHSGSLGFLQITAKRLKLFSDRHLIVDGLGNGWLLDSRRAFRSPTNDPRATSVNQVKEFAEDLPPS